MAEFTKVGYGQVEPNHLSAQRTSQIYAQLPADTSIEVLENGQFVKYNYKEKKVDFTGAGEWMMVFNEVKLYDGWRESHKDFAMKKENYVDGEMVPRVIKTNIGDIFTTSAVETTVDLSTDNFLTPNPSTGFLKECGDQISPKEGMVWQIVKKDIKMPDCTTPAVKIMRIK